MRFFIPLLRLLLGTLLVAVTMETAARLDDWFSAGAPLSGLYDISVIHEFDDLGQKGKPGTRFGKWQMNSLGYRGPELTPGSTRILAIGSSETFGQYESEGHEWPRLLERKLNQDGPPHRFEVVNTAIAGETLPSALRRMDRHVAKTHPQAAILYPSLAHYLYLPYLPEKPSAPAPRRFALRISGRVDALLKRSVPESVQSLIRDWQAERASRAYGTPLSNMPVALQQRFAADLESVIDDLRSRSIEVILVTHAHRFGSRLNPEDRFMLINWRKFYPMLSEDGFLPMEETMNRILTETARHKGVKVAEIRTEMPVGPRYFADFVHFTDAGSAAFSDILARQIRPCFATTPIRCPQDGLR
jgi:hypothetical protein